MAKLILVRHGASVGNERNEFTGMIDAPLTPTGWEESRLAALDLTRAGILVQGVFSSCLARAMDTAAEIKRQLGAHETEIIHAPALNERDYGLLAGMNREDARAIWGPAQVQIWRRSYTMAPPGGESIRDTAARVWPFYMIEVLPLLLRGRTILLVAHGNTLRTLMLILERLTIDEMLSIELPTARPVIYQVRSDSLAERLDDFVCR